MRTLHVLGTGACNVRRPRGLGRQGEVKAFHMCTRALEKPLGEEQAMGTAIIWE